MSNIVDTPLIIIIKWDLKYLIRKIRGYEPNIFKMIFNMVYVACSEDIKAKHKCVWALPAPGTDRILEYSFRKNKLLKSVIIDDSVKHIDNYAFGGIKPKNKLYQSCISLANVKIGNSVTYINYKAFSNCINLTEIVIPDSVKSIACYAFYRCKNVKKVILCKNVMSIYDHAFDSLFSLTEIIIPNSVKFIGKCVFHNCKSLKKVSIPKHLLHTMYGDMVMTSGNVFDTHTHNYYSKTEIK